MLRADVLKLTKLVGGGGGGGPKPKPEVAACKGKKEKDACWFGAAAKQGVCVGKDPKRPFAPEGHLWCKTTPERPKPEEPKPEEPKPEVAACTGKLSKQPCWFGAPGAVKKGYCVGKRELRGTVWWSWRYCLVEGEPQPKPEVEACEGKKEKEACGFLIEVPGAEKMVGFCVDKECKAMPERPKPEVGKPEVAACTGKKEKDACWFGAPGAEKKGYCVGKDPTRPFAPEGHLWCKAMPERAKQTPEVAACTGKKEKDACWLGAPGAEKSGSCVGKDPKRPFAPEGHLWCDTAGGFAPESGARRRRRKRA